LEIDTLQGQLDKMTSDFAALKVQSKSVSEDYARLNETYKTLDANLKLSNRVRQQAEDNLTDLSKQYHAVKEAYHEKEHLLT
jgi:hypothetical protein